MEIVRIGKSQRQVSRGASNLNPRAIRQQLFAISSFFISQQRGFQQLHEKLSIVWRLTFTNQFGSRRTVGLLVFSNYPRFRGYFSQLSLLL